MSYGNCYRDFLRKKRRPVEYLPLILRLQQSLSNDERDESMTRALELEEVARLDRIHALEEYLLYVLSRLMYVHSEREMMEFTYSDVLHNLSQIQTYNRLKQEENYITVNDWHKHFDAVLDAAREVAFDACMTNECRGWSGEFDREALWRKTQEILSFTYLKDKREIDRALRSYWSYYTFFPY